jgi:hypothetical protein
MPQLANLNTDSLPDLYWFEPRSKSGNDPGGTLHTIAGRSPVAWRRIGYRQTAGDLDGDGINDLLTMDQLGRTMAVCGRTGQIMWQNTENALMRVPLRPSSGDIDEDGDDDLLLLHQGQNNQFDLVAIAGRTGETLWTQAKWVSGRSFARIHFAAVIDADVAGQRQLIVVRMPHQSPLQSELVEYLSLNPLTDDELWRNELTRKRTRASDYTVDPDSHELIEICRDSIARHVVVRSLADGHVLWQQEFKPGRGGLFEDCLLSLPVGDFNADGQRDVISMGDELSALTVESQQPLWTWRPTSGRDYGKFRSRHVSSVAVAHVGEGRDIACLVLDDRLFVVRGAGELVREIRLPGRDFELLPQPILIAEDLNADGRDELLLTCRDSALGDDQPNHIVMAVDPESDEPVLWELVMPATLGNVFSIRHSDEDRVEIVAGSGTTLFGLDGATGQLMWTCTGPR